MRKKKKKKKNKREVTIDYNLFTFVDKIIMSAIPLKNNDV